MCTKTFNGHYDVRWFKNYACAFAGEETGIDYLDTEDGQQYIPAFKHIRLIHIVTDPGSVVVLNADRIIPRGSIILFGC